jgi:hypothetical protein
VTMAVRKSAVCVMVAAVLVSASALTACSGGTYEIISSVRSPNGTFVAQTEFKGEGTLGSSRYRVSVSKADGTDTMVVFKGVNGWFSPPLWQNESTLIIPFCFGSILSVESILPFQGSSTVQYRSSNSANVRVHVVTMPSTSVAGNQFCADPG